MCDKSMTVYTQLLFYDRHYNAIGKNLATIYVKKGNTTSNMTPFWITVTLLPRGAFVDTALESVEQT